jgi:hypothetical protein
MAILRQGVLEGRAVALGGHAPGALRDALIGRGAQVEDMSPLDEGDEERVGEWARSRAPLRALVYVEGGGGLEDGLAGLWTSVREVAVGALIPSEEGGKIVLVAPAGDAPVAAALENLARTLSVEWARFGVTVVAVAPGAHARPKEVAEVVCYLVSVAGDYFSGCRFDLGLVSRAAAG